MSQLELSKSIDPVKAIHLIKNKYMNTESVTSKAHGIYLVEHRVRIMKQKLSRSASNNIVTLVQWDDWPTHDRKRDDPDLVSSKLFISNALDTNFRDSRVGMMMAMLIGWDYIPALQIILNVVGTMK